MAVPPLFDAHFVLFQLESMSLRKLDSSTTTPSIRRQDLEHQNIVIPPLEEQCRIVAILEDHLSHLDTADALVERAQELLRMEWTAFLAQAMNTAKARGDLFLFGDLTICTLGKMLDAKRQTGEPTPYLRNINVRWGSIDVSDVLETPLKPKEVAKYSLLPGDLLVCEGGEPGRCALWESDQKPIAFQKALHRVRVKDSAQTTTSYLALVLEAEARLGRLARLFTGTTIKHLTQEKLKMLSVPLPVLSEQARLVQKAAEIRALELHFSRQLSQCVHSAATLRRSLLATAFRGDLTADWRAVSRASRTVGAACETGHDGREA